MSNSPGYGRNSIAPVRNSAETWDAQISSRHQIRERPMTQITTRQSEAAPLTYRIDPLGALVGYAAVYEVPVKRSTRSQSRNSSREAFVPSCPFQWSLPTSMVRAPIVEPADAILDEAFDVIGRKYHAQNRHFIVLPRMRFPKAAHGLTKRSQPSYRQCVSGR